VSATPRWQEGIPLHCCPARPRNEFRRDRGPTFSWTRDTGHEGRWSLVTDGAGCRFARSNNQMATRR